MLKLRIAELCRQLRLNQTNAEQKLWVAVKARQFAGYKFRRQHPFIYQIIQGHPNFFIADFYCARKKLIVELDGKIHDYQKDYDENRDEILAQLGLQTIRIKNEELEKDLDAVLHKILRTLEK